MAVYTVVIDTGDADQDDVLAELEQVPSVVVVQFMGPGALVTDEDLSMPAAAPSRAVTFEIDELCSEIDAAATDEVARGPLCNPYNMAARLRNVALLRWDQQTPAPRAV